LKSELKVYREAYSCVEILKNISLRGSSWPATCAAAIGELQAILAAKIKDTSISDTHEPTARSTPWPQTLGVSDSASRSALYASVKSQANKNEGFGNVNNLTYSGVGSQDFSRARTTSHRRKEKPQGQDRIISEHWNDNTQMFSSRNPDYSMPQYPQRETLQPPTLDSRANFQNGGGISAQEQLSRTTNGSNDLIWANTEATHSDNRSKGLNSLFQLLDAPYLMSEQMLEAQHGSFLSDPPC